MKKILAFSVISLIVIFLLLTVIMPSKMGGIVYQTVSVWEANFYGMKKSQVDISEMKISLYKNKQLDRPTIMMLHGFSADKNVWLRFAKHFTNDFNVVIPDMAGHGETGFDKAWDYSSTTQASRLKEIIEALGINKVHIIGNSMGGAIAAQFALNYADSTITLALVDPAGVTAPKTSDMDNMLIKGKNPFKINSREEFDSFYELTMENPPWIPDFILEFLSDKYQTRQPQLMQIFADFHGKDSLDNELNQIHTPTLLIWGAKDRLLDVSSATVWQQGMDNIEVEIYPEIGHVAMLEIPKQSAERYLQFLQSNLIPEQ